MAKTPDEQEGRISQVSYGDNSPNISGNHNRLDFRLDLPPAKITSTPLIENQPEGKLYKSVYRLSIETQTPIPSLTVEVSSPTLVAVDLEPDRSGTYLASWSGIHHGLGTKTLQNAYGDNNLTIRTSRPEGHVSIRVSCDGARCVVASPET